MITTRLSEAMKRMCDAIPPEYRNEDFEKAAEYYRDLFNRAANGLHPRTRGVTPAVEAND